MQHRPSVSIVAPCYNESKGLPEFHRRCAAAAQAACGGDYEIVLVDDGSKDGTWETIATLARADAHVTGVQLMRNYGHQPAATAGLGVARGERVLLIDADLQDPPELLTPMMRLMDDGADVVYGQRTSREAETWFKTWSASTFYHMLSRLAATPIPRNTGDFRLMRRTVVDALATMPERQRFIRGMVSWIGGRQVPLGYERQARFAGTTQYPLAKMVRFALDAITSFSTVPLRLASYLGLSSALLSVGLLVYSLIGWLSGSTIAGWTSVITAISAFGAVQLLVLGILGEYIGRLFQEAKARPLYFVGRVILDRGEHLLPVEFSGLSPAVRQDVLDALAAGGRASDRVGQAHLGRTDPDDDRAVVAVAAMERVDAGADEAANQAAVDAQR